MSAIACTGGCSDEIPVVAFSDCNPEINESQIDTLFITQLSNPLADWTSPSEMPARISNTSTATDAIRNIPVIGGKPRPEITEREISRGRTVVTAKKHTINFTIDESNDDVHDWVRNMKCVKKALVWYKTTSNHLFGGTAGIDVSINIEMELNEANGEIIKYTGTLKWETLETEERIDMPF